MFDAEHFFDGCRLDENYALSVLRAARDAGADWLVLCDTNGGTLPDGLDILHKTSTGRLQTIILHGASAELEEKLSPCKPLFMDFVPLTLEEIFIYELGGADYEVKDIVL